MYILYLLLGLLAGGAAGYFFARRRVDALQTELRCQQAHYDALLQNERDYAARRFLDTAYCVPTYLKDFQATKPKKLF